MKTIFPFPDAVVTQVQAKTAPEVLAQCCQALQGAADVDGGALLEALQNSENNGGSAIGDGVAVVSVRVPEHICKNRLSAFVTLKKDVSFMATGPHPCDLVFVLVSPETQAQTHLRDLSCVIRTLRDNDFSARLRTASSADRVAGLFRAREAALIKAA